MATTRILFQSFDFKPTTILDIRQRTTGLVCVSRHFCDLLLGRDVTLVTNHKHLTFALEKLSPNMSPRQINYISQFCKTIKYIPGLTIRWLILCLASKLITLKILISKLILHSEIKSQIRP